MPSSRKCKLGEGHQEGRRGKLSTFRLWALLEHVSELAPEKMTVMAFAVYQVFQQRCQARRTHLSLQHFLAFANHNEGWRAKGLQN